MKKIVLCCLAVFLLSCNNSSNSDNSAPEIEVEEKTRNFDWLLGDWERTNDDGERQTYESWEKASESEYVGIGYTMIGNDTTWGERMTIIKRAAGWNFEVFPGDVAEPTIFKITKMEDKAFTCENPENDFPKVIDYKREGDNINAVISDGENKVLFAFKMLEE